MAIVGLAVGVFTLKVDNEKDRQVGGWPEGRTLRVIQTRASVDVDVVVLVRMICTRGMLALSADRLGWMPVV